MSLNTVTAVEDKIIVEIMEPENKTEGGIFIPDGVKRLPQLYGKVLSVGPKVIGIVSDDIVMCHPNGGQVIIHNGKICKVLCVNEVYGTVTLSKEGE